MADYDIVKQRIISSVFTKRNAAGGGAEEAYAAHVKIFEDAAEDEGGRKPRYIIISQAGNKAGFIHKAKLNANGTFSVGKSWKLLELRGVEVVNSLAFNVTLARTYRWQTENPNEQANFVVAIIRLFRSITGGALPLQLTGLRDPDAPSSRIQQVPPQSAGLPRADMSVLTSPLNPTRRPTTGGTESRAERLSDFSTRSESPTSIVPPTSRTLGRGPRPVSPASSRAESPDIVKNTIPPLPALSERSLASSRATRPAAPLIPQPPTPLGFTRPRRGRQTPESSSPVRVSSSSTTSRIPSITTDSPPLPNASTVPSVASLISASPVSPPADFRPNGTPPQSLVISNANKPPPLTGLSPSRSPTYDGPDTPRPRPQGKSSASEFAQVLNGAIPTVETSGQPRREANARVSFYDPAYQSTLDRLLSGDVLLSIAKDEEGDEGGGEVETEHAQATLTSVEEMLEGYEWASENILGGTFSRGTADQIEARLLDELMALEKANVHSFIETDDRINAVMKYLDDAIAELDGMDSVVSSYKIHLNVVNDDIAFIQSQNRGLQVQIQNQRALLTELEELLQTVQVDREALLTLTQESLEQSASIARLEGAATQLYKALQAGRDRDMAATMERLDEYRTHNTQFCKRVLDFLSIMFTAQSTLLLGDNSGVIKPPRGKPTLKDHKEFEAYLGRYGGLLLYLREMDEGVYGKLCAAYFSASSELHGTQVRALLNVSKNLIKKVPDEEDGFGSAPLTASSYRAAAVGMRRAGTIVRSPLDARRERRDRAEGEMYPSDAFALILEQVSPMIYREQEFIADFLQINDAALTFADYMGLENYFRRQAARSSGLSAATMKLVRGAMDLIFGFIPAEFKTWLDSAVGKDIMQMVGMIVCLERFLGDAEDRGNAFLLNALEKIHTRLKGQFDRRINDHIKNIENTRLTSRKRNGVAPFIKYFPAYVARLETQLIGADALEVRQHVDQSYEKLVQTMFDSLKQMAKMDGEGEDKGQLNYHVILIENMHYYIAEISQIDVGTVSAFLTNAQAMYDENLNAYIKLVLHRQFAKIIDYFNGVERLLKTTAPTEVASNSTYSKSALRKVLKEFGGKDVRKHVDALFKRVEKHFTESAGGSAADEASGAAPSTALVEVWQACEEELLRITELFSKRISQCYQSAGVTLEYSAADIEAAFKRHRVGA